jgi:response regulator of citrate/malate metabolism
MAAELVEIDDSSGVQEIGSVIYVIDKKGRKHLIKKILSSDDPCKVLVVTLTNEVKTIETC